MRHFVGIDLHCNNNFLMIIDEVDRIVFRQRLLNDLQVVLRVLQRCRESMVGIAVESTFNWYWLVDRLMEAGYELHLVNTAAVKQYEELKYPDDCSDARWLAHLLRLGLLPTGYIYPKEDRPLCDLLRKRAHRVRQQIRTLERVILAQVFDHTSFQLLETIIGVGKILALTIYLETGQITCFRKPGDYL